MIVVRKGIPAGMPLLIQYDSGQENDMDWTDCEWVECVPGRLSGVPVVVGSRVQAQIIVDCFDDGMTLGQIAWSYSLPRAKVCGVLEFARGTIQVAA